MTDKQMADKKKEFMKMFAEPEYFQLETNEFTPNGEYGNFLSVYTPEEVWQWIEKLIQHYYTQGKIEGYKECLEEEYDFLKEPTDEERIKLGRLREEEYQRKRQIQSGYESEGIIDKIEEIEDEWEMMEDIGFLYKDNKLIPIKKGFKLKVGKDQEVTKFKLGKDN